MTNGEVIKMVLKELIRQDYFTDARTLEMANLVINDDEYLTAMLSIVSLSTSLDSKLLRLLNEQAMKTQLLMIISDLEGE